MLAENVDPNSTATHTLSFYVYRGTAGSVGGTVDNNVFVAGNTITIKGYVSRDVFAAGSNVIITKDSVIDGNLYAGGNSLVIDGQVKGNVRAAAATLDINGQVDKSVYTNSSSLSIGSNAKIQGDVVYTSENEAKIDSSSVINGSIERKEPVVIKQETTKSQKAYSSIYSLLSALLLGVVLISLFPKKSQEISETIAKRFWPSLGVGFLTLIVVPMAMLMLLLILIGAPIALILFAVYLFLMYSAKIFAGLCFGNYISKSKWSPLWAMTLGVILISIIQMIPFIGPLATFVVILIGLGSITLLIFSKK